MITVTSISDPASKIIALQRLAEELARRPDCKTAHGITMREIRKAELKLETAKMKGNYNE